MTRQEMLNFITQSLKTDKDEDWLLSGIDLYINGYCVSDGSLDCGKIFHDKNVACFLDLDYENKRLGIFRDLVRSSNGYVNTITYFQYDEIIGELGDNGIFEFFIKPKFKV